jgi:hypothetical protein
VPSLTRGRVCNLLVQLLLGLARAVTLGSKFRRTHDHILLSHLRLPQPGGPGSRIYIPLEQGGPVIPPGTEFPFCHPLQLAGLLWRYSNHTGLLRNKVNVTIYNHPAVATTFIYLHFCICIILKVLKIIFHPSAAEALASTDIEFADHYGK